MMTKTFIYLFSIGQQKQIQKYNRVKYCVPLSGQYPRNCLTDLYGQMVTKEHKNIDLMQVCFLIVYTV